MLPVNGGCPASSSYRVTPSAYTSPAGPGSCPLITSGAQVGGRAEYVALGGDPRMARQQRDAEVGQQHPVVVEQRVGGLDVTVHDAGRVRGREPVSDLGRQRGRLGRGEPAAARLPQPV